MAVLAIDRGFMGQRVTYVISVCNSSADCVSMLIVFSCVIFFRPIKFLWSDGYVQDHMPCSRES